MFAQVLHALVANSLDDFPLHQHQPEVFFAEAVTA
jgi:hypothetical protein